MRPAEDDAKPFIWSERQRVKAIHSCLERKKLDGFLLYNSAEMALKTLIFTVLIHFILARILK